MLVVGAGVYDQKIGMQLVDASFFLVRSKVGLEFMYVFCSEITMEMAKRPAVAKTSTKDK